MPKNNTQILVVMSLLVCLISFLATLATALPPLPPQCPPLPPPCTPISDFSSVLSFVRRNESCTLLPDGNCTEFPVCPPETPPNENSITLCGECPCLFNHSNCQNEYPRHCLDVTVGLGLNCGSPDDPIEYLVAALNETSKVNETLPECLLRRICGCLSRVAQHHMLVEIEESCQQLCRMPSANDARTMNPPPPPHEGRLHGNITVCRSVHSQYCRRHKMNGRPAECARVCVQDNSCETLIERILEDDFIGSDLDAALSVLRQFRHSEVHHQQVRELLRTHGSFYGAVERNHTMVISNLNNNNSKMLMSIFDDLLSNERQAEWAELQLEDESPGEEVLERIETTSELFGISHQTNQQFLQNFQYIGDNIEVNVECQRSSDGYEYVFNKDSMDAVLFVPPASETHNSKYPSNCTRVLSATLSSNLGDLVTDNSTYVNTNVMTVQSVEMDNEGPLSNITMMFRLLNTSSTFYNATCVFWNFNESTWSTEGVVLLSKNDTHYTCQSNHLTSFAVLVSATSMNEIPSAEARALSIVTYIGCVISIVCLIITLLWLVILRKALNKGVLLYIHFNLFLALLLALIVFVSGIDNAKRIKWMCTTVAVLLHYLFLCVFCWMLAEGIVLYVLVVKVFNTPFKKWYYLLLLGWGMPLPIVAVSVGLRHSYYGTDSFCWLSLEKGVIWSFIGPMLVVILINTVILVLTVASIVLVKRKASTDTDKKNMDLIITSVKSTVVLLPLLGITWIIGLFAVNENTTVFAWIFTILNSLQGMMIFVLHILRNKKVRRQLLIMVGIGKAVDSYSTEYTSTGKRDSQPESTLHNDNIISSSTQTTGVTESLTVNSSPFTVKELIDGDHEHQTAVVKFSEIVCEQPS